VQLKPYHEIVGTIEDIVYEDGFVNVIFSIQTKVEFPESAIQKGVFNKFIGKRVGILNLDGMYKIRRISSSATNEIGVPPL
jgi:hypothetical protein